MSKTLPRARFPYQRYVTLSEGDQCDPRRAFLLARYEQIVAAGGRLDDVLTRRSEA